ncbi:lasso peptide biosynthesis B2 protein [Kovacikia minuta CCNUW1]|uniref:lasso peptide biosynthesis B2 protein n=1 Tax=Kovacikia minuta TaxID=2931930 RepID=UPI001CCABA9C|nr:lasso peptide biosynthesis B2 protein [Kovacikia minuta]UBF26555.1 lasso peptide biosynthesis B2 protein [Kovacikia minuta CCNUW1]
MKQLHKVWLLSSHIRFLLIRAFTLLACIRLGLWLLSFRQLNSLIQRVINQDSSKQPSSAISIDDVIWAIETATHYLPGQPKCLARALATQLLLQRYGYRSDLRIGVAINEMGVFTAHAWIERNGQVLIGGGRNLSAFTPLPSFDCIPN